MHLKLSIFGLLACEAQCKIVAILLANNYQHCWMLHVASVAHPVAVLLGVVGSCCTKFETSQIFSHVQMAAITPNIVGPTMLRVVASVNTEFDSRKMNVNWKV